MTTSISDVDIAGTTGATDTGLSRRVARRAKRAARTTASDVGGELKALRSDATDALRAGRRSAGRAVTSAVGSVTATVWWQPSPSALDPVKFLKRTVGPVDLPPRARRRMVGWTRAFFVGLCMFALWTVLDAPTLLRSAQASPLGVRRSVAMGVLRPLSSFSNDIGAAQLMRDVDQLLGRTGPGVVQVVVGPRLHRHATVTPPVPDVGAGAGASATDALPPLPTPTAAAPLRVLSVGDSLGVDFGGPFVNDLAATGVVNATLDAHVDTGLSRPDYFDWPAELQSDLTKYQPQAVVVFLGANDPQNFVVGGQALSFGTQAWRDAYSQRVGDFMAAATSSGARVMWIGMPPMADPVLNAKMASLDQIYASEAASHPGVTYLSSWPVFSDPQGSYAQYLPDSSGAEVDVREPDGTHVSPGGAERLSRASIAAIDQSWGIALRP